MAENDSRAKSNHNIEKGYSSAGASAASLGIYAKTSSAPSGSTGFDPETGEVFDLRTNGRGSVSVKKTPEQGRWERWSLKSVANKLLPGSRTSKCMRWRRPDHQIELCRGSETGKAYYHGLQVCASVWACPVCAAKITERRRAELVAASAIAKAKGMQVMLATLTVPHGLGDDVSSILDRMQKAYAKLSSTRAGAGFKKSIGLVGTIRALEVTHGENGFHPHFHILYFIKPGASVTPLEVEFSLCGLWQDACLKVGLPLPDSKHGCRVDDGSWAARYCSKWGLESEMTKSHTKSSKGKSGRSMWDLLRAVLADPDDKKSGALFQVYAKAFHGRRQLYWSNGLRKLLAVVGKTDEEVANEEVEDTAVVLAEFTDDEWRAVYSTKSESALLDLAEKAPHAVPGYLKELKSTWSRSGRAGRQAEPTAGPPVSALVSQNEKKVGCLIS